jgi:hypothetical protein
MEHEGRIEGGDARESGEGAEEERGVSSDEREAVVGRERGRRAHRRHQEEEVEEKGKGREVSKAAASCCTTGLGPRGMTVRYCPLRGA